MNFSSSALIISFLIAENLHICLATVDCQIDVQGGGAKEKSGLVAKPPLWLSSQRYSRVPY